MRIIDNWRLCFHYILKFDKAVRQYLDQHRIEWENKTGPSRMFTRIRVEIAAWRYAASVFSGDWRRIE